MAPPKISFKQSRRTTKKTPTKKDHLLPPDVGGLAAQPHQKEVAREDTDELVLRNFDLTCKYGPVSGLSRLQRYQRAREMKLNPPVVIKELIEKHGEKSEYNRHVFSEGKL